MSANTDLTSAGNITTQNLVPAGVATAASAVELNLIPGGFDSLTVQVTGTYTGALSVQATLDGSTWVTLGGTPVYIEGTGLLAATIASASVGLFKVDIAGFMKVRVTGLAAMTGTAVVSLRAGSGTAMVALKTGIPLTSVVPGTSATSLGKAEDAVAASGDTGVMVLAVRRDALATTTADGDYNELKVDQYGALLTKGENQHIPTYSAITQIALAASATDVFVMPGSASKTILITKLIIGGIQTTAGLVDVLLIKRSTAASGGTTQGVTTVPHNATDSAASAVPLGFTANPTPGTTVGTIRRNRILFPALASVVDATPKVYDFGANGKPIILNGVAQALAINLAGATVTGGSIDITVEWLEV